MTLPQRGQRTLTAQDGRRRAAPPTVPPDGPVTVRARMALPAVDPRSVFGCVDWFQYPDQAVGLSAAEGSASA